MSTICIDFDGTIVKHDYPAIGEPVPHAIETMMELQAKGHSIILFTMRHGDFLQEAADYVRGHGIHLYGVNENPKQHEWTQSRKVYGHHYIDDAAIGCPLKWEWDGTGRPFVDWIALKEILKTRGIL